MSILHPHPTGTIGTKKLLARNGDPGCQSPGTSLPTLKKVKKREPKEVYRKRIDTKSRRGLSEEGTREPVQLKRGPPPETAKSKRNLRHAADHGLTADSHPGSGHQQRRLHKEGRGVVMQILLRYIFIKSMLGPLGTENAAQIS